MGFLTIHRQKTSSERRHARTASRRWFSRSRVRSSWKANGSWPRTSHGTPWTDSRMDSWTQRRHPAQRLAHAPPLQPSPAALPYLRPGSLARAMSRAPWCGADATAHLSFLQCRAAPNQCTARPCLPGKSCPPALRTPAVPHTSPTASPTRSGTESRCLSSLDLCPTALTEWGLYAGTAGGRGGPKRRSKPGSGGGKTHPL